MGLKVICSNNLIAQQINNFSKKYHKGFLKVRILARDYLKREGDRPNEDNISNLARQLRCVLNDWGAGKKKAPRTCDEREITDLLHDKRLCSSLAKIEGSNLHFLNLHKNNRVILDGAQISDTGQFDQLLLSVLKGLSDGLFIGNTNVTYPMKALLLITGLMPAFDSNVKAGLRIAGIQGVNKTQFLLPREEETNADMKKLTRLPFLLGHCWANFSNILKEGIQKSQYQKLIEEPGRVFDILFFMQGKCGVQLNTMFDGPERWYDFS